MADKTDHTFQRLLDATESIYCRKHVKDIFRWIIFARVQMTIEEDPMMLMARSAGSQAWLEILSDEILE